MNAFLTAIASHIGANIGGTVNRDLYVGALPDDPPDCTAVCRTGGKDEPGNPTRYLDLTFFHRSKKLQDGETRMTLIHSTFADQFNVICGFPGRFVSNEEPGVAGYDARNLIVFTAKFTFVTTARF